jgi:nucleoside-diphosphate-sugar epimerase
VTDRAGVILVGGAGFVGTLFTDALLADESTERVAIYGISRAVRRATSLSCA